ncbi:hypothetical protein NL676_022602 [Syzygium grande]|nr:hypothetical protein NL676_022602 [Syzygium grande]
MSRTTPKLSSFPCRFLNIKLRCFLCSIRFNPCLKRFPKATGPWITLVSLAGNVLANEPMDLMAGICNDGCRTLGAQVFIAQNPSHAHMLWPSSSPLSLRKLHLCEVDPVVESAPEQSQLALREVPQGLSCPAKVKVLLPVYKGIGIDSIKNLKSGILLHCEGATAAHLVLKSSLHRTHPTSHVPSPSSSPLSLRKLHLCEVDPVVESTQEQSQLALREVPRELSRPPKSRFFFRSTKASAAHLVLKSSLHRTHPTSHMLWPSSSPLSLRKLHLCEVDPVVESAPEQSQLALREVPQGLSCPAKVKVLLPVYKGIG